MLTPDLAQRYLESCEIALQRCQQRLDSDGPGSTGDVNIMESPESEVPIGPLSTLEQHLQRILGHLNTMHTISSVAWRQRPHHASGYGRSAVNHLCHGLGKARHTLGDILLFDDQRGNKTHHIRPGVKHHDAGFRSGIEKITRAALVLRLKFGANQQAHPANITEQIKLGIQLLQVFDEQFAFRVHAIQHRRSIDQIESGVGDRACQRVAP